MAQNNGAMANTTRAAAAVHHQAWTPTLTTRQMAEFVANGVLRFDALVPGELNQRVLAEMPAMRQRKYDAFRGGTPVTRGPATGTPLSGCHHGSALGEVLALPELQGIVASLVGPDPLFDHDFVHHLKPGHEDRQHLHPDAIVDSADPSFDIQIFYFPHDVGPDQGGTRFVPGTHLRRVTSTTTARYQNIVGEQRFVGPAGTILIFHHGLWHAGDHNPSQQDRWMYKIRLNPQIAQVLTWDLADFDQMQNDATDHVFAISRSDSVAAVLRTRQRWQSEDAWRYDLVERVKVWRYLSADLNFDVDHYLTRLNRPSQPALVPEAAGELQ